jgi:hypothetical protein
MKDHGWLVPGWGSPQRRSGTSARCARGRLRTLGFLYVRHVSIIEVFADAGCPFTHVGLRRLVEHRDHAGRDDVVLRVRAWPLELVNGHPLDPFAS